MSNKLAVSAALLAAAIATAACEKVPSGGTNQSSSVGSDEQASGPTRPTLVKSEASKPNQAEPGRTDQEIKPAQAGPGGAEQEAKSIQAAPGESEPGRQRAAKAGEDRNAENNTPGQPSQQDRNIVQSDGGTPAPSAAQPNQPPQAQSQLNEQQKQARGTVNLSPEQGSAASSSLNLSRDDIRRLQVVLNQKGFNIGKPDGVLAVRTRNALIAFQRQQGLEPTGKIDQPTITALGLSNGGGSTTTGQSGAGKRQ